MRVLITGATGLIGKEITRLCHEKKISVNYLTTSREKLRNEKRYHGFFWNPATGEIDVNCLKRVGVIINLAGENVFQRWTGAAKKRILSSRVNAANLLFETLRENEHEVGEVVSASAIGVYPSSYSNMYYEDEKEVDDSFLGKVVVQWEASNNEFEKLGLRVAKVRTGLVLAEDAGALPQMQKPFTFNMGAALGSGKQWQSWIHIRDLARIYVHIFENGLTGAYNAVAPNPIKNKELMEEVGRNINKKIWLPNVPAFALKAVMGETADMVLSSQLVASKKILDSGFTFIFTSLSKALEDLDQKKTGQ